jgi:hypothetical protein
LADHDLFYLTGSSTSATRCTIIPLGTQITLTKDTEYAVTLQNIATASANLITNSWSVASATHWNPFMYYPSSSVTRDRTDDSSPSFTQDTLKIYSMGLVIDAIDDGSGGSSSSVSRGNIPVLWK